MAKKKMSTSPMAKARRHETEGDRLASQGKPARALKAYRRALDLDPANPLLCDKLIALRDQLPGEWELEDFAESVGWAMLKQEQEHPPIKQTHARLTPEWKEAAVLAVRILAEADAAKRAPLIEELVAMGEVATRAMIGLLLEFRRGEAER